jgi:hypothetical protein
LRRGREGGLCVLVGFRDVGERDGMGWDGKMGMGSGFGKH